MLSDATKDEVRAVVGKMTDNDEMFTAFDVTHVIRVTVDPGAPHHEVKGIVHGMFGNDELPNDYARTPSDIDVGGKTANAFVYHPQWKNPMDYDPHRFQDETGDPFDSSAGMAGTPTVASTPAPSTPPTPPAPTPTPTPVGVGRCDKRGRISVPAKIMRRLGCYPGSVAWVVPSTNQMTVHRNNPGTGKPIPYVVDRSGNIRISSRTARIANIAVGRGFAIACNISGSDVIMIS